MFAVMENKSGRYYTVREIAPDTWAVLLCAYRGKELFVSNYVMAAFDNPFDGYFWLINIFLEKSII